MNLTPFTLRQTASGLIKLAYALAWLTCPALLRAHGPLTGNPVDDKPNGLGLVHFVLDSNLNTGNNSTIVLPTSVADTVISTGDEIGVFTGAGVLCGAAAYTGANLAITVWGDDPSTNTVIEGMQPDSAYYFKVWDASAQIECVAFVVFTSGINAYEPDAIEVIQQLTLCKSTGTVVTATACNSYVLNNQTFDSSGVYTQVLTNLAGCDSIITLNLTISPVPVVTVNSTAICAGQTAVLQASGADSYLWSTGATTDTITVSPTVNSTYTVTGTTSGCASAPATAQVTVHPIPVVTAAADKDSICAGQTATLTARGAQNYIWSNGDTTETIIVSPGTSTPYTVTGISAGCSSLPVSVFLTVKPLPTVSLGADTIVIYTGQEATLTASGMPPGLNYNWSTGATTDTIHVSAMGAYTVTVSTNSTPACTATASVYVRVLVSTAGPDQLYTLLVNPNPAAGIVRIVCTGASTDLVQVVENTGKILFEDKQTVPGGAARTVDLESLPAGLYYLRIVGEGFVKTVPFIKGF